MKRLAVNCQKYNRPTTGLRRAVKDTYQEFNPAKKIWMDFSPQFLVPFIERYQKILKKDLKLLELPNIVPREYKSNTTPYVKFVSMVDTTH